MSGIRTHTVQPETDWATGSFHNKQDTDYRDSPDTVFDNGEDLSAEEEAMEEDLTPEQVPGVVLSSHFFIVPKVTS
jgi:hypothetical protein